MSVEDMLAKLNEKIANVQTGMVSEAIVAKHEMSMDKKLKWKMLIIICLMIFCGVIGYYWGWGNGYASRVCDACLIS